MTGHWINHTHHTTALPTTHWISPAHLEPGPPRTHPKHFVGKYFYRTTCWHRTTLQRPTSLDDIQLSSNASHGALELHRQAVHSGFNSGLGFCLGYNTETIAAVFPLGSDPIECLLRGGLQSLSMRWWFNAQPSGVGHNMMTLNDCQTMDYK